MKWQMILPVVALLALAFTPQAALAHHHHHCWNNYGMNGMSGMSGFGGNSFGGMNPWQAQRMMQMQRYGGSGYGMGYGGSPYGGGYGYGNNGGMMNTFGRVMRGF